MKMKISSLKIVNNLLIFTFGLLATASAPGQAFPEDAPVKWAEYSVKSSKATFLMPKMPVVVTDMNPCRGEFYYSYGSYARGSAYVVRITKKIEVPEDCGDEGRPFDKTNFEERVAFLTREPAPLKPRGKPSENEVVLEGNNRIYRLVNDFKNNQWVELMVVKPDETKVDVKNFLDSLKIGKKTTGIEIGDGAPQTLGDKSDQNFNEGSKSRVKTDGSQNSTETPGSQNSSNNSANEGVTVILKPRANYTDRARRNETQGKVVLRVVFNARGGIGAISVVSGLPDGLTEQAIAAARRLLFIPARRNGVAYSVVKPVEYTFTIY
jgi:TonB family protein